MRKEPIHPRRARRSYRKSSQQHRQHHQWKERHDHSNARPAHPEANAEAGFTALEAVEALRDELARDGVVFALARVKQDLLVRLTAFGLAAKIGQDRLFPTLPTAVAACRQWAAGHKQHPGEEQDGTPDAA